MNFSVWFSMWMLCLSALSLLMVAFTSWRVWRSHQRVIAAEQELVKELERVKWTVEQHNPGRLSHEPDNKQGLH